MKENYANVTCLDSRLWNNTLHMCFYFLLRSFQLNTNCVIKFKLAHFFLANSFLFCFFFLFWSCCLNEQIWKHYIQCLIKLCGLYLNFCKSKAKMYLCVLYFYRLEVKESIFFPGFKNDKLKLKRKHV